MPPDESNCGLWRKLMSYFEQVREADNNAILSVETLSRLPVNDMTMSLWRSLLNQWDVEIFLYYRPFDQWVQSLYIQNRKGFMYKSSHSRFNEEFSEGNKERSFPDWFQEHRDSNFEAMRDTLSTQIYFDNIFGSNRVHVLDMLAPDGLESELFCNNILNAVYGCKTIRSEMKKIRHKKNQNGSAFITSKLDTDLIIVEAHRQNLGDLGSLRATSREKIDAKLIEWNMTTADLPKVCVSQEQESWLWNRTLYSNRMFSHNPLPDDKLQTEFAISRKKYCSVDTYAVLQNSTWREYLSSCEFKKNGCIKVEAKTSDKTDA